MAQVTQTSEFCTQATLVLRNPPRTCITDYSDDKGRRIGAYAECSTVDMTFGPYAGTVGFSYYRYAPGRYYAATVQATRDGKGYGATQARVLFTTPEARDAYVEKRFTATLKAAAKKYGAK